ncbi:hypothetical protein D3C72_2181100 [compost metagenome]
MRKAGAGIGEAQDTPALALFQFDAMLEHVAAHGGDHRFRVGKWNASLREEFAHHNSPLISLFRLLHTVMARSAPMHR